jgi:DNA invertase Pin-like site-specific DNA recombinase
MAPYFAYIRVSTTRQGSEGVSLVEQRDAIARYAERHGLRIAAWFEEQETAAKRGRPVFSKMLALIRKGEARGLIIHKIDRSARNLRDWADLGDLIDLGADVHFATESLDLRSRGGRLSADIQAVVAADYIRNLREEVRKGFYGRLKQGLCPLRAPLGYLDCGTGKPKALDPDRAPFVRTAFELYVSGRYSLRALNAELHQVGLRTRSGQRLSLNALNRVLRNPFYVGVIRIRTTGESFAGVHPPLISRTLFTAVQDLLDGKGRHRTARHHFVFSRLFRCRGCGYSLIGELQKGHRYYRCHTKDCPTKAIREELLLREVERVLEMVHLSPEELSLLDELLDNFSAQWATEAERLQESFSLQLKAIGDRLLRLTDAYIDGQLAKDAFDDRRLALLMEKRDLEERIARSVAGPVVVSRARAFLERAQSAQSLFRSALNTDKRELLETLTSNRTVLKKDVAIELRIPFSMIAARPTVTHGGAHRDGPRTSFAQWAEIFVRVLVEKFRADEGSEEGVGGDAGGKD